MMYDLVLASLYFSFFLLLTKKEKVKRVEEEADVSTETCTGGKV
jgi:hypothetical protein